MYHIIRRHRRGEGDQGREDAATSSPPSPSHPHPRSLWPLKQKGEGRRRRMERREGGNEENPGSLIHFVESAAESGNIF